MHLRNRTCRLLPRGSLKLKLSSAGRTATAVFLAYTMAAVPVTAQSNVVRTPNVPFELPVEIETDLAPGSLKQAPLWKEIVHLLDNPTGYITCPFVDDPATPENEAGPCTTNALYQRRPRFQLGAPAATMPPLNVWNPCVNVGTAERLRLRTSDGEINWDVPGPMYDPNEVKPIPPTTLRTIIGQLVACPAPAGSPGAAACTIGGPKPPGSLVVFRNPGVSTPVLPPTGTVVAIPACNAAGQPLEIVSGLGTNNPATQPILAFEKPINEIDFLRPATDVAGLPPDRRFLAYVGRQAAEVLGKALFWDMQLGSDGVQACGTCHFHAGVDNRTKNALNPNHLGGDVTLQVAPPNGTVVAADFPFRKLGSPDLPSEGGANSVVRNNNDVMSSMGVRFRNFLDVPAIGTFLPAVNGVQALPPDLSTELPPPALQTPDPIGAAFQGLRRVEPRNTPTMHAAAFNFDNFWDGRARHDFNGGSVFGATDPFFHLFIDPITTAAADLQGTTNGHIHPDLLLDPDCAAPGASCEGEQPIRIRFSSLASQVTGPPLSDFEMSFAGRNHPKIGKKLLQAGVTPLANQLVDLTDSRLGPFSNQGGSLCAALPAADRSGTGGATALNKPGLCISYPALIRLAFARQYWQNTTQHLNGAPAPCTAPAVNGALTPATCDPFDGYTLAVASGPAAAGNTNQFTQMEGNFSFFLGMGAQMYMQLLIPDDTPFDRFMDANPLVANAVAQPGEQGTLPPSAVPGLVGSLTFANSPGFGPEELFGFDIFAGANVTAALPVGSARNPAGNGSNPFLRNARCHLCHFGPEQSDHTNNVSSGVIHGGAEFEYPIPPTAPEPAGVFRLVTGIELAEELIENLQDGVEVEPRSFATLDSLVDDPLTIFDESTFDDRRIGQPKAFAFQDNGVYNIGVRPTAEDISRGGGDPFGWPLSVAALALKNLGGPAFEPPDDPSDPPNLMANFDPDASCGPPGATCAPQIYRLGGGLFEPNGTDQRINPGLEREPAEPLMPGHIAPWLNDLPAGELHPQKDELAFAPNTITEPLSGPAMEFSEIIFGADLHCAFYTPAVNGTTAPDFGWGPDPVAFPGAANRCPSTHSGVPNNDNTILQGTWPFANRVGRMGAFKAPQLRNVELTGPYFHTGSYLTLRQVVDFYIRGGDFPVTNAEHRDPNIVDVTRNVFGFGATSDAPPLFADGFPDTITQYDAMPDLVRDPTQTQTPEPAGSNPEAAKVALVRFLLSLTDQRVRIEAAPFDRPEIFVPLDGLAPDNTLGAGAVVAPPATPAPGTLGALSLTTCDGLPPTPAPGRVACFQRIPAVGATGHPATPFPNFLGISSCRNAAGVVTPSACPAGPNNDHFDR